jgi:hypothetical protein
MLGVRVVAVAKAVGRRDQHWNREHRAAVHPVVVRQKEAHFVAAMACRAEEQPGAERREQWCPNSFLPDLSEPQLSRPAQEQLGAQQSARSSAQAQVWQRKVEPWAQRQAQPEQQPMVAARPLEQQLSARAQQVQPASAQLPLAAELQPQVSAQMPVARARRVQPPDAVEPLWPPHLSLLCPPELSLQLRLLHPRRPEGACEPSRLRPSESSSSASSFLLRRTRATGR